MTEDPYDRGRRYLLNYGHTVAHALELISNFTIDHGAAVGLGLLIESYLSYLRNLLSKNALDRIVSLLFAYGYQLDVYPITIKPFLQAATQDKKGDGKHIYAILIESIGTAAQSERGSSLFLIERGEMVEAVNWIRGLFHAVAR